MRVPHTHGAHGDKEQPDTKDSVAWSEEYPREYGSPEVRGLFTHSFDLT